MPHFPHILMAEDEDLVALALSATNGRQALEAAEKDLPDLLVTDMRMQVMPGGELIAQFRQRHPGMPVVVMTGFSDSIPDEEAGQLVVVLKPFPTSMLVRAIQSLLPRAI